MWSAEVISKKVDGGNVVATLRFTDDTGATQDVALPADDLDDARIKVFASAKVASLEKRDKALPAVTIGPVQIDRDKDGNVIVSVAVPG